MNKKKGSAMVLAILLLAFFMALSLNMWFISEKKAQRSGDKVLGNKVLTDIDGSSTLGYYEFYLATEYMNKGFITTSSAVGGYIVPAITTDYAIAGIPITTTIEGISLSNEKQYFGSYLASHGALTSSANAILDRDVIIGNKLTERNWTVTGGAIVSELWEASDWSQLSFGGYRITTPVSIEGAPANTKAEFDNNLALNSSDKIVKTNYTKTIKLGPDTTLANQKNKAAIYDILVKRTTVIKSDRTLVSDDIDEIIVTKQ